MKRMIGKRLTCIGVVCVMMVALVFAAPVPAAAQAETAVSRLTSVATSDHFGEEYLRAVIVDNSAITISGRVSDPAKKFYLAELSLVDAAAPLTQSSGTVDSITRRYETTLALTDRADGTYHLFLGYAEEEDSSYWGKNYFTVEMSGGEVFFAESDSNLVNRRIMSVLEMADPSHFLDTAGLCDTEAQMNQIKAKAQEITQNASGDYEKIQLIHNWVADNVYYNYDGFYSGDYGDNDPYPVFTSGIAVCQGYAELSEAMLRAVGVPCMWLAGYAEGASEGSDPTEPNHAWNAAYADGRWVIFDSTWDSANTYYNAAKSYGGYDYAYFDTTVDYLSMSHVMLIVYGLQYTSDLIMDYDTDHMVVSSYTGNEISVVIPSRFGAFPVTEIAIYAFQQYYSRSLKRVTIPDSVTVISQDAFYGIRPTIVCTPESYAYTYARNHRFTTAAASTAITQILLNHSSLSLEAGESARLEVASVLPVNVVWDAVSYESSDPAVAAADENGLVTGVAEGTADISVTVNGVTEVCPVTVGEAVLTGFTLNHPSLSLQPGAAAQLQIASVEPAGAVWDAVSYESSDPAVAAVDENGLVTGVAEGAADISVTVSGVTVTCSVTVSWEESLSGDANGDGFLTALDIILVRKWMALGTSLTESQINACDMNGDSGITALDIMLMRKIMLENA